MTEPDAHKRARLLFVAQSGGQEETRRHRLEDVPLERRFCNHCGDEIRDDGDIGDLWWEPRPGGEDCTVVLCRDCA